MPAFAHRLSGNIRRIDDLAQQQFAMLTMLNAMCRQALDVFRAGDRPDDDLVDELESMVERTRRELTAFTDPA
jgi:hypothetical protein